MAAMSTRAVAAVRGWDARVTAEHGPDALWLACSHGDVIKAIVADALGLHLDLFQRVVVDPGSVTAIRYTPTRPFLATAQRHGCAACVTRAAAPPAAPDPTGGFGRPGRWWLRLGSGPRCLARVRQRPG